jgi:hypothetical protein
MGVIVRYVSLNITGKIINIPKPNIFTGTRTQDNPSVLWPLLLQSPRRTKQLWSWRRSSIVLSFRATETTLTGTRTQDTFCRSFDPSKSSQSIGKFPVVEPKSTWPSSHIDHVLSHFTTSEPTYPCFILILSLLLCMDITLTVQANYVIKLNNLKLTDIITHRELYNLFVLYSKNSLYD